MLSQLAAYVMNTTDELATATSAAVDKLQIWACFGMNCVDTEF